jgi:type IV pilus assembly protein PilC
MYKSRTDMAVEDMNLGFKYDLEYTIKDMVFKKLTVDDEISKKINKNKGIYYNIDNIDFISYEDDLISIISSTIQDVLIDLNIGNKIGAETLAFSLTQLSTYIKSGIPLADSVSILAKQATKKVLKQSFTQLHFELIQGENFSAALEKQDKYYPGLLINMVKTAEMTGDLPTILDDMAEYYTSMDQTRKQMRSRRHLCSAMLLYLSRDMDGTDFLSLTE